MRTRLLAGAMLLAAALGTAQGQTPDDEFTIPAGSTMDVQLITTLSTKTSETGDLWRGKILESIWAGGREIVPAGCIVAGHVAFVKEPGRAKGRGEMRLVADTITTPDHIQYAVTTSLQEAKSAGGAAVKDSEGTIKGPSSRKEDAKDVGIGAAIGAGVGTMAAGAGKGTLYGAAAGAIVAGVRALAKRGKDVVLGQGTELTFTIERDTHVKRQTPATSTQ